jgi:hypothetical protein
VFAESLGRLLDPSLHLREFSAIHSQTFQSDGLCDHALIYPKPVLYVNKLRLCLQERIDFYKAIRRACVRRRVKGDLDCRHLLLDYHSINEPLYVGASILVSCHQCTKPFRHDVQLCCVPFVICNHISIPGNPFTSFTCYLFKSSLASILKVSKRTISL